MSDVLLYDEELLRLSASATDSNCFPPVVAAIATPAAIAGFTASCITPCDAESTMSNPACTTHHHHLKSYAFNREKHRMKQDF